MFEKRGVPLLVCYLRVCSFVSSCFRSFVCTFVCLFVTYMSEGFIAVSKSCKKPCVIGQVLKKSGMFQCSI